MFYFSGSKMPYDLYDSNFKPANVAIKDTKRCGPPVVKEWSFELKV